MHACPRSRNTYVPTTRDCLPARCPGGATAGCHATAAVVVAVRGNTAGAAGSRVRAARMLENRVCGSGLGAAAVAVVASPMCVNVNVNNVLCAIPPPGVSRVMLAWYASSHALQGTAPLPASPSWPGEPAIE